jgi:hypothetical protein
MLVSPWNAILPVIKPGLITEKGLLVEKEEHCEQEAADSGRDAQEGRIPTRDDAVAEDHGIHEQEQRGQDDACGKELGKSRLALPRVKFLAFESDREKALNAENGEGERRANCPEL